MTRVPTNGEKQIVTHISQQHGSMSVCVCYSSRINEHIGWLAYSRQLSAAKSLQYYFASLFCACGPTKAHTRTLSRVGVEGWGGTLKHSNALVPKTQIAVSIHNASFI